ncbi:MAG: LysM peptidoglycan-binding domain-containing protein [Alistipes sp.]|nr:LysM peptidoglycan-binding domain-containing protein [Alistipes sp.]
MIEVVYTPKDNGKSNDVIRLPKNIKQVGDIKDSRKIYIEDYAINFIEEVHKEESETVVGVLMGMAQKSGSDRYVFIKGAIMVPNVFVSESQIAVAENDWSYIYEIAGKYFPSQEIVGWFISIDRVNASILRTMKKTHADNFGGGEKVLFVFDRQENSRYFCTYENSQFVRQNGYTIYYERNEEMQEYMVDMRNGKRLEVETEDDEKVVDSKQSYRSIMGDEEKKPVPSKSGKRQAFVNYCANVAMVVLILFIGMYVVDSRKGSETNVTPEDKNSTVTPVIKVDGDVYPTESATSANQETGSADIPETTEDLAAQETTTAMEQETTFETETTGSYLTVNTNVVPETTAAEKVYKEHTIEKGENLLYISKLYYGDSSMVKEIMKLNDIKDMDKIYEGQTIKLP